MFESGNDTYAVWFDGKKSVIRYTTRSDAEHQVPTRKKAANQGQQDLKVGIWQWKLFSLIQNMMQWVGLCMTYLFTSHE